MNRKIRTLLVVFAFTTIDAMSANGPLRIEIWLPGASTEETHARLVNMVEPKLKERPGITSVRSIAVQSQATMLVAFEFMPKCVEIEAIRALVERERPKGATRPLLFLDNLTCGQ
jgi:multidrug efflux pump subunit AcrB